MKPIGVCNDPLIIKIAESCVKRSGKSAHLESGVFFGETPSGSLGMYLPDIKGVLLSEKLLSHPRSFAYILARQLSHVSTRENSTGTTHALLYKNAHWPLAGVVGFGAAGIAGSDIDSTVPVGFSLGAYATSFLYTLATGYKAGKFAEKLTGYTSTVLQEMGIETNADYLADFRKKMLERAEKATGIEAALLEIVPKDTLEKCAVFLHNANKARLVTESVIDGFPGDVEMNHLRQAFQKKEVYAQPKKNRKPRESFVDELMQEPQFTTFVKA